MTKKFYVRCIRVGGGESFTEGKLYMVEESPSRWCMMFYDDGGDFVFMGKPGVRSNGWKSKFRFSAKPVEGSL